MSEKLKSLIGDDTLFIAGLLVLTAMGSFGLGRASVESRALGDSLVPAVTLVARPIQAPTPISVPTSLPTPGEVPAEQTKIGAFVASKSGTKYHLSTCPGAQQIKVENKIYFATAAEAAAAGYTKAANCPGL